MKLKTRRPIAAHSCPYPKDSIHWHLWQDLAALASGCLPEGYTVSLSTLADFHFTEPQFYLDNLEQLILDGFVELIGQN